MKSIVGLAIFAGAALILGGRKESSNQKPSEKKPEDTNRSILHGRKIDIPVSGVISSVLDDKRSHGPHQGIDIAAPAGSVVRAWGNGSVIRVVDGRVGNTDSQRRAGLWIDVAGDDGNTHRYLHLGKALVKAGMRVSRGQEIGTVEKDHLHFEIRQGRNTPYGAPQTPNV
jgi:murein DD-endopeptidase MepM/ murein hydrolase activator NlpD